MEILKNEILPLFEMTRIGHRGKVIEPNQLIQTDLNEYSLYVELRNIYLNQEQSHQIMVNNKRMEYTIPLHYHEIVLQGKGYYYQDIKINIYSLQDPNFIRVNRNDLLTFCRLTRSDWSYNQYTLIHLDGEVIQIELGEDNISMLRKIPQKGLPNENGGRGCLYLWLDLIDEESPEVRDQEKAILLEILNYHENSNVKLNDF